MLASRGSGKVLEYRIKWKGFASSQSVTWELAAQVKDMPGFSAALAAFLHGQPTLHAPQPFLTSNGR